MPPSWKSSSVLSIDCSDGGSRADERSLTGEFLSTGDIVEELRIGESHSTTFQAPFKNGKKGVQKILHKLFEEHQTSVLVRVRRGASEFAQLEACIVPNEAAGKKKYMLRSVTDPNYAVGFVDRTETECLRLQASRNSRMVQALEAHPKDGCVPYDWEKILCESLAVSNSSLCHFILFLPKASDQVASAYNDLEDTLARADTWLKASQVSGVPIIFSNIQTDSLLTKISGETASSTVNAASIYDLSNLGSASLYGFEDYHGVDLGLVRAVRLWYSSPAREIEMKINLEQHDAKLGFAISRTEEGFIYVSSVINDEDAPSTRSGLHNLYMQAKDSSMRLVVSRISNQKILPWIVSSTGGIRCYDTVSLSEKLSSYRRMKISFTMHFLAGEGWEKALDDPTYEDRKPFISHNLLQHERPLRPQTHESHHEVPFENLEIQ